MKKLFVFLFLFVAALSVPAQDKIIPLDPNLRFGVLDNGLTYYIRHNEYPAQRAEFFIAQRVGSVLEEENQRGLAHFLEHMAFNGTKHFPNASLRNYLETIGVKFGENLNAYTSFDETVYNISNVPTIRDGIVDSVLLILHDWSNQILLEGDEIDKERGVIREEWRTRNNAGNRIWEQVLPQLYPGSRYGNRMPIGTREVIDNFKYDELRAYYHRWYRPDLQAIIIVGDIDVNRVEKQIKNIFSDIPAPAPDAPERVYFPVPDNVEPIVAIATDPEATGTSVSIFFKHNPVPDKLKNTETYYLTSYLRLMATTMMNARLSEIAQKPDSPFLGASVRDGGYLVAKTKDAWQMSASAREGEVLTAFEALLDEMQRVLQFGFTPAEYERAKANLISRLQVLYNERDNAKNINFVNEYVSHFTDGEPSPGIEFEFNFVNQIADMLTVKEVNDYMKIIADSNRVVLISGPEKENVTYPAKEEILQIMNNIGQKTLTPYEENLSNEPLVPNLPTKGKIKKISKKAIFDTKELRLSNGAVVSLKKTYFKDDQVLFSAIAEGGLSVTDIKDLPSANMMDAVLELGGLGNFSAVDLRKQLAGKTVSLDFSTNLYSQYFSGGSNKKDVETLLQLLYLYFTAPRQDLDAYQAFLTRKENQLKNRLNNPMAAFSDSITRARYGDNPYVAPYRLEDLQQADYDRILMLYREHFVSDASAYHFTFVGNIDEAVLLPLIERYIASLPSKKEQSTWRDVGLKTRAGEHRVEFEKRLQTPKASVYSHWSGDVEHTLRNQILHSAVMDIMKIVYTEKIREEQGGTYGVSVSGGLSKIPHERFSFSFRFDTDAPLVEPLLGIANAELQRLQNEGPSEENWQKVKEFMLKKHAENLKENGFWLSAVQQYYDIGFGWDKVTDYVNIVNSITTAEIRDYARRIFSQGNNIKVIQMPKEE